MEKETINHISAHAQESEKAIERHLVEAIEGKGGLCLKFSSQTQSGYPDRICLLPGGIAAFVELKSKGRKPSKLQRVRIGKIRELGFPAAWCDSKERVDQMIKDIEDAI